jgi:glutathione reductase (NADPH)
MVAVKEVDFFVIGAGSGGVRAARTAAALGASVAIAEDKYFGGTCVNVGCIPKKLYSYASHYHFNFQESRGFGWEFKSAPQFNWRTLRENKKKEISRLQDIYINLLRTSNVSVYEGRAKLLDAHTIQVGEELIRATYILIAVGGWPQPLDIPGGGLALDSNAIFDLPRLPKRLLIIGGGYIAVEFAGIFAGLGVQTSLSYRGDKLLRGFDSDIQRHFTQEIQRHLDFRPQTQITTISVDPKGTLTVTYTDGKEQEVDAVLAAVGRLPRTQDLGLENTQVKLSNSGQIAVDEQLQTNEPSIFAVGDVVGHMTLTPVALAEGMFVADKLFGTGKRQLNYENIPTAVFSHPNLATVGLTQEQAQDRYHHLKIFESNFRHLRHTLSGSNERTYIKIIVDAGTDKVLGMHMMGSDAGEIIQGFASAMIAGITKAQLDNTIGIHPTAAEEFVTLRTASYEWKSTEELNLS